MRRSEFNMKEKEEIDSFLLKMSYGFLATHSSDEFPNLIPINYVWFRDKFYFHGARTGRKMTEMKANEKVSFAIADEYSIIPSYFTDPKFACPATSFFKSVIAYGVLEIIEDLDEKVLALT
ncbi:MAG TPA: pyridoxamine 5'-phosphate oxidase family protein, partial [Leptospiraceae bacterium]|nr:pyridoxamine 5'-phosphate oxidase family protein [Leptospiraceae bacterium]